jgi:hypothetical protein
LCGQVESALKAKSGLTQRFQETELGYLQEKIWLQVNHKKASRLFFKNDAAHASQFSRADPIT